MSGFTRKFKTTTLVTLFAVASLLALTAESCEEARSPVESSVPTATLGPSPTPTPVPPTPTLDPSLPTRPFLMGVTPFPYAGDTRSFSQALDYAEDDGDLIVHHFDDGIPWEQALTGADYPESYIGEMDARDIFSPDDSLRYIAVTPINFGRDGLAQTRDESGQVPLEAPWDSKAFDDPDVVTALLNHIDWMVDHLHPDYLAYGVEVNMLAHSRPELWDSFVRLASQVYPVLKERYPDIPIFTTFQVDWLHAYPEEQEAAIRDMLPYTDILAASSYRYANQTAPADGSNYFTALHDIAPDKPFAVGETGWPAEDVVDPWPDAIEGSPEGQREYVEWLIQQSVELNAEFIVWYLPRDLDIYWDAVLHADPQAATLRLFKDMGLRDGGGEVRPAGQLWHEWAARPLVRD